MGHLGFSYVGFLYLLMLMIPNILWAKHPPEGYDAIKQQEHKGLLCFERIGQALVTCTVLLFSDFNPHLHTWSAWSIWLVMSVICMVLYEFWWIRYFRNGRALQDFYGSFAGIPLAGATLPILGFLLLGIYGKVIWLILSVVFLGIGHIGIHARHCAVLRQKDR